MARGWWGTLAAGRRLDAGPTIAGIVAGCSLDGGGFQMAVEAVALEKGGRNSRHEIGEEFVEFLEKELNMNDDLGTKEEEETFGSAKKKDQRTNEFQRESSMEDIIDDIEATLAQLKKNLGL
ncbi:hypothetical protein KSP39_PZI020917 [Platanthera zijinensis]|uniref:Uncharacterized protein n=1 Tax=Platanthera zijinensis TaxID=2320716 RepID=A0AAP0FVT3_9ASPA